MRNVTLPALRSPKTGTRKKAAPGVSESTFVAASASEPEVDHAAANALAQLVADQLEADKAENIVNFNLLGKSSLADAMVIASGRSQRHVNALADHVARKLKDAGVSKVRVEGLPNADWVLIDAGDVIVHIFRPEVREFYNLERLWTAEAPSQEHEPRVG